MKKMLDKRKKIDDQMVVDWLRLQSRNDKLIAISTFYQYITQTFNIWQPYRILKKLRDKDKIIMVCGRYIKYIGFKVREVI